MRDTVTTLLTWEPRRTRVIVAKATAGVVSVFVLTVLLQLVLGGVLAVDAATQGSTAGADGAWAAEAAGVGLRVALVSSVFAGFGFGIASIGRNTAAALGVGFGYIVIVENLVRGLRPAWAPWLLTENAGLFLIDLPGGLPTASPLRRRRRGSTWRPWRRCSSSPPPRSSAFATSPCSGRSSRSSPGLTIEHLFGYR